MTYTSLAGSVLVGQMSARCSVDLAEVRFCAANAATVMWSIRRMVRCLCGHRSQVGRPRTRMLLYAVGALCGYEMDRMRIL